MARSIERAPEPSPPPQEEPAAEVLYGEILAFIGGVPKLVRKGGEPKAGREMTGEEFAWGEFRTLVERAIRSLESSSDLFWLANSPPRQDTEYLAAHLANVGILSLRIGMAQGYSGERLVELGMAAFLFDLGMWRLPEAMLGKTEQLSDEDVAAIRSHPRLSAEIVRRWQPPLPSVVEMIQQHHEREQGQGYPQGLAGDAVNSGAKIIGLMDTYAALIHPRPYRPRFPPHEAVREILRSKREGFPSHLVKTLLAEISVFPPRTVVKLNNGEVGRVIAVNRNHPLRPKVEIFADARGSRLAVPKILDLSEAPFIYITGPLAEAAR